MKYVVADSEIEVMKMILPRCGQNGILADYDACLSSPDFIDMFGDDDDDYTNNFMSEFNSEDLLATEILPRLTDSRTAIRCSAVSKQWQSLISAPEFIPNFNRLHRRPPSYAMFVELRFYHQVEACIHEWCSSNLIVEEGPTVTAGVTDDYNFPQDVVFESACDDFFLVSTKMNQKWDKRCLYIRNAVSGQLLPLPNLPVKDQCGFAALVSHPNSTISHYNYRVAYIGSVSRFGGPSEYYTIIFSSETGKWSGVASAPTTVRRRPDVVAANGLLYWINTDCLVLPHVVIFDAFSGSWRFVDFPDDHLVPRQLYRGLAPVEFCPSQEFYQHRSTEKWPHIGVVQGRVRIVQLFRVAADGGGFFVMKIWELSDDDNKTWRLASEVQLRGPPPVEEGITKWLYFFSLHPGDSDVVFLSCGRDVYSYCLSRGEYKRIFTLSTTKGYAESIKKDSLARFAHILTMLVKSMSLSTKEDFTL